MISHKDTNKIHSPLNFSGRFRLVIQQRLTLLLKIEIYILRGTVNLKRKNAHISFATLSVCLSAYDNPRTAEEIFTKYDTGE